MNGADQNPDLFQETIRQGLGLISEKLDKLIELVAEGPSAGHVLALTQATQYQGLLDFHRLMLEFAAPVARDSAEKEGPQPSGISVEELAGRIERAMVVSGLSKVMAPPFEKALMKAAAVASRVQVTTDHQAKEEGGNDGSE